MLRDSPGIFPASGTPHPQPATAHLAQRHSEGKFSAQCVSNKNIHSGRVKLVKLQQMRNTSVGQKVYAPADVKRIEDYNKNVTSLKTLEGFASADMIEACDTVSLFSYK